MSLFLLAVHSSQCSIFARSVLFLHVIHRFNRFQPSPLNYLSQSLTSSQFFLSFYHIHARATLFHECLHAYGLPTRTVRMQLPTCPSVIGYEQLVYLQTNRAFPTCMGDGAWWEQSTSSRSSRLCCSVIVRMCGGRLTVR